jgi:hypothetical protein
VKWTKVGGAEDGGATVLALQVTSVESGRVAVLMVLLPLVLSFGALLCRAISRHCTVQRP